MSRRSKRRKQLARENHTLRKLRWDECPSDMKKSDYDHEEGEIA